MQHKCLSYLLRHMRGAAFGAALHRLFDGVSHQKPVHERGFGLADAIDATDGLCLGAGVEQRLHQNHVSGFTQVLETKPSSSSVSHL
jgi:hypothetical protein